MTAAQRGGGPAFPVAGQPRLSPEGRPLNPLADHGWMVHPRSGMTLRDYFAAKAMQGMVPGPGPNFDYPAIAAHAYRYADAMLAAREAQP